MRIPIEPLFILHTLQQAGFDGYIVGGAVRDLLRNARGDSDRPVTDIDLTTNATPEQIKELFPESFYENDFGTVSITQENLREQAGMKPLVPDSAVDQNQTIDLSAATKLHPSLRDDELSQPTKPVTLPPYEITTYRSDGSYQDHRRPESVTWGETLEEDLERRDFTINAMAFTVPQEGLSSLFNQDTPDEYQFDPDQITIIDPHRGQADLDARVIKTVGDPHQRFQEDALRMLRAIRFAVQLDFEIDSKTYEALHTHADLLQHISGERIRDEFLKMLASEQPKKAITLLDQSNLLGQFLPELLETKGVEQGGHHTTNVWTHSLDALAACPSPDPIVRLATLLHDIAKPQTYRQTPATITFYNHEVVGSRVAKQVAQRLKLSKKDIERIFILVRFHMFHYQPENTDAAIRRFMRKVGLSNINDILDLREADRLGSGARKTSWRLEEMKERITEQLHQPFDLSDLAVGGDDLIKELGINPGPVIGELLNYLLEETLENPELNSREKLLIKAREKLATQ